MHREMEVVVTGIGLVSPIGLSKEAAWDALSERRSGVARLTAFDASQLRVPFGAEVKGFDGKNYIQPRKSLKVMCREVQMGVAAAALAMNDAHLSEGVVDPDRFGVVFGGEMHYGELGELADVYRQCMVDGDVDVRLWGERAMTDIFPLWMLKYLPNMPACHIGIAHDARGPSNTIVLGEVSGLMALIESAEVIRRGRADVMIAGGTGSRLNITPLLYRGDLNLSRRIEDPAAASRPFDAQRDGMVNGEGAAALILEEGRHARARGATILARVLGSGSAYERPDNTAVDSGSSFRSAICRALESSGLEPRDIGWVKAHGLSDVAVDAREARAIRQTLADVPVTAPKSYFGNLGAGGAAAEAALAVQAMVSGQIPVTLNYDHPDPNCPIRMVHDMPLQPASPQTLLLNQSGTGQTAALVLAAA